MEEYWPPVVTLASDIGSDCGITAALVPQFTAGAQWLDGLSVAYIPHNYLSSQGISRHCGYSFRGRIKQDKI